MSERITSEELSKVWTFYLNEGPAYACLADDLGREVERLVEEELQREDLEKALRLAHGLADRARTAKAEGRSCTLTEHTFRVLEDAGLLGIPKEDRS